MREKEKTKSVIKRNIYIYIERERERARVQENRVCMCCHFPAVILGSALVCVLGSLNLHSLPSTISLCPVSPHQLELVIPMMSQYSMAHICPAQHLVCNASPHPSLSLSFPFSIHRFPRIQFLHFSPSLPPSLPLSLALTYCASGAGFQPQLPMQTPIAPPLSPISKAQTLRKHHLFEPYSLYFSKYYMIKLKLSHE